MKKKYDTVRQLLSDFDETDEQIADLHEEKDALISKSCDKCGKELYGEQTYKETFEAMADDEFITMMSIEPKDTGAVSHTCGECLKAQSSIFCALDEHGGCDGCRCSCHSSKKHRKNKIT